MQRGNTMEENARLFVLLNIAEADAGILCWDCKYACNFWRPITAIQNADLDENPATEKDADWTPLLATPPFPEYTSGHSTFSSAGATVLAAFFGSDNIPFTTVSEDVPGVSRSYASFSEAAAEAGMSRIYGGIHFMSANQQGLLSGARLGQFVTENSLKKTTAQQTARCQRSIWIAASAGRKSPKQAATSVEVEALLAANERWCRFACPLAALMHIYARFSRYRIFSKRKSASPATSAPASAIRAST